MEIGQMECVQYCWGRVFLTIAVFGGLSFITPNQHSLEKPSACDVGIVAGKKLLVFEVVSFNFFLFSSLVAEGLKLAINLLNSKDVDEAFRVNQGSYAVFWKIGCQNPKYVVMKIIKGRMKQECLQTITLCLNTWNMTSSASLQSRVSSSLNHKWIPKILLWLVAKWATNFVQLEAWDLKTIYLQEKLWNDWCMPLTYHRYAMLLYQYN